MKHGAQRKPRNKFALGGLILASAIQLALVAFLFVARGDYSGGPFFFILLVFVPAWGVSFIVNIASLAVVLWRGHRGAVASGVGIIITLLPFIYAAGWSFYVASFKSAASCERYRTVFQRAECYRQLAVVRLDAAWCQKVSLEIPADVISSRAACFAFVAKAKADPAICRAIDVPEQFASCIGTVALKRQDPSVCDAIQNLQHRTACYVDNFNLKKTFSFTSCDDIPAGNAVMRDQCWRQVADQSRQASACAMITTRYSREACTAQVAIATNDLSLCLPLPSADPSQQEASQRDLCIEAIANQRGDVALCAQIVQAAFKNRCLGHFGQRQ